QTVAWRRRRIVAFAVARPDAGFADELGRRLEEVVEGTPVFFVKIVEQRDQAGVLETLVSKELPHMRPVLLLHVGVVVFAIGPAAAHRNGRVMFAAKRDELFVEVFGAVVEVESGQVEGNRGFDIAGLRHEGRGAAPPDRAVFRPARTGTGEGDRPDETARHIASAMGHGVGFQPTRPIGRTGRIDRQRDLPGTKEENPVSVSSPWRAGPDAPGPAAGRSAPDLSLKASRVARPTGDRGDTRNAAATGGVPVSTACRIAAR